LDSQSTIKKIGRSYILYDDSIITEPTVQLFDADYHTNHHTKQPQQKNNSEADSDSSRQSGIGRARVCYFEYQGRTLVLKHYYRGGAVAAVSKDCYLGVSIIKSRAFREYRLLKKMQQLGLPVPVAVAAHMEKGFLYYRADLITEKIADTVTLADMMESGELTAEQWRSVGSCIKRFHHNNIYHADLNARNILLDEMAKVYLIDFDNSGFRAASESWKQKNLERLKRSCLKFKTNARCYFNDENWRQLVAGYHDQVLP